MVLDPLNRRATRRTFISRASKGARRVAEEEGGQEVEEDEYERGTRGKGNDKGGPRTPQQCGIWRVLVSMSASRQHAMQFSCRLHHQSVFSHEAAHRATGLSPCPATPPYPIRQPIPAPRSRSTWLENALCVPSASFSSFSFSTRLLTLFFSLALGRRDSVVLRRSSPSPDAGHKLQASPDMSGPPRREIRGIPSSGIACAYPPPFFSLPHHHLRFHLCYLLLHFLFFLLLFLPRSALCRCNVRRY